MLVQNFKKGVGKFSYEVQICKLRTSEVEAEKIAANFFNQPSHFDSKLKLDLPSLALKKKLSEMAQKNESVWPSLLAENFYRSYEVEVKSERVESLEPGDRGRENRS